MRISLEELGRNRTLVSVAGSVAIHALVFAALVWVKPPLTVMTVKRGEPLFVELPEADEQAQRGLPAPPTPERAKVPPAPKPVVPAARPAPAPPAPPMVAKAAPEPEPAMPLPAPSTPPVAPTPEPPPSVAQAPTPAEPPREAPPEAAGPRVAVAPPTPRETVPDIRSALRRGGPGPTGAGGSGEGRAGIEGEPIPLDSKDPRYNDYLDRIRRMIKSKWGYPCVRNQATDPCEYKSAQLTVEFGILKEGRVPYVTVLQRSGFDIYDDYAVNAIKFASPFPPLPPALMAAARPGSTGVPITVHFIYVLESSLTNLLR